MKYSSALTDDELVAIEQDARSDRSGPAGELILRLVDVLRAARRDIAELKDDLHDERNDAIQDGAYIKWLRAEIGVLRLTVHDLLDAQAASQREIDDLRQKP